LYGQATTIIPGVTPCLKCIFPKAPPKEVFPVVGVTPGFIGMIQATEVIKYLVRDGRLLTGRLLIWDGLESHAEEICVERDPKCTVCGGSHAPAGKPVKTPVKAPVRKKK
jgi:adenylyltransferase/sulfurtransferase